MKFVPTARLTAATLAAGVATLLLLTACDRNPVKPPEPSTTCSGPGGTVHRGEVSGVWRRVDGPHRLPSSVFVLTLTIEAGSLICAAPGAALIAGSTHSRLEAHGTETAPVIFTAAEPGHPWGGILMPSSTQLHLNPGMGVQLSHVIIEDALVGIDLRAWSSIDVEYSVIRRIDGVAVFAYTVELRDVIVDSACMAGGCVAVGSGGARGGRLSLVRTLIRGSGGYGVAAGDGAAVGLSHVRIEGSRDIGLSLPTGVRGGAGASAEELYIVGGASYPAYVHLQAARTLFGTVEAQARLLGNAADTLLVDGGYPATVDTIVIGPQLPWMFAGSRRVEQHIGTLRLLPRASLGINNPVSVRRIEAEGTAADPVSIHGAEGLEGRVPEIDRGFFWGVLRLDGRRSQGDTVSVIRHATLRHMVLMATAGHPLTLEAVTIEDGYLGVFASGSRLDGVHMRGSMDDRIPHFIPPQGWIPPLEALHIAASDVHVSRCEVTGSLADGIRVSVAADVSVHDCDIHSNAGVGLRNTTTSPVDARHNWWGDAAGPSGPAGNGVAGPVDYNPFRSAKVLSDAFLAADRAAASPRQ